VTKRTRFDELSASYDDLLRDPVRDRFAGGDPAFFHFRKSILILDYFRRQSIDTSMLSYLDVGCGKGELLTYLRPHFCHVAGCDVSAEMMLAIKEVETRVQHDPLKIPFPDNSFDFISVVCVYHHVIPDVRQVLLNDILRVLKPCGVLATIEHNPFNPITRLIVSRTPVDADAVLLKPSETRQLMRDAGLLVGEQRHFLYFPEKLYHHIGALENLLRNVPLGGQYALFATKPGVSAPSHEPAK
jgi:SAM-dependent methyltransferase